MKYESNTEALGESAIILDEDESVAMSSVVSGDSSRQYPESGPSTRTQNEPLQEERIEVGVDRVCYTWFRRYFPRIFEVVESGDREALSNFLTNYTTINSINSKGHTALHHAVASACRKGDYSVDSFYQCIDLLMSCEKMQLNRPDKNGYTAIGLAVHHLHRACVELMLKHPSAYCLYLDYYPRDRESTLREIIKEVYPELQPLLPAPIIERLDSSEINIKLLAALQHGKFEVFRNCLCGTNVNLWYYEPYHFYLLEITCQMKNREEFVEHLLNSGADPNTKNRVTGMPLLQATARSGNFGVLQILLEKEGIDTSLKDNEKRTVLHWLASVSERKPGDKEKIEKCLKLLLKSNYIRKNGVDDRDSLGNTALYIAVEREFRDRAKLLLSTGADVRVFESGCKMLLSDSVSIVREILYDCLQSNDKPLTSKDLQLTLNYQPLNNIVPRIAVSKLHKDLLTHPVMSTFLSLKWQKVGKFFFLNMALYVIFLLSLTAYILLSEPYNTVNDGGAANDTIDTFSFNDSNITSGINNSNFTSLTNISGLEFLRWIVFYLLACSIISVVWQLIFIPWVYVYSMDVCLIILLIIATIISCSGVVESAELIRHSSAVALLLGWSELLMISGRIPLLSVQYEMFTTVSLTFLKFMAGYVTLLIAFALSFYILFKGSSEQGGAEMFANPPISLLKTIVMFTGEFDASSLSFNTLPYTSHVIFLLFVFLVAIVLLNLLNGLAVNDTGEIRRNAETLSLAARAKLISVIERTDFWFNKKPKGPTFVIYPNRRNKIGSAVVRSLLRIIREKTKPNQKEKLTAIQEEWSLFKEKLSDLQFRHDELDKKLDSKFDETLQILRQILTARHEV